MTGLRSAHKLLPGITCNINLLGYNYCRYIGLLGEKEKGEKVWGQFINDQ